MNARTQATLDLVKTSIEDALRSLISITHPSPSQAQHAVNAVLSTLKSQDVIHAFQVHKPETRPARHLCEVKDLPAGSVPGDKYVDGLIISVDRGGEGTVLFPWVEGGESNQVVIKCDVQPTAVLEYVRLEATIA